MRNNKSNFKKCLKDDINILHYISDMQDAIAIDLREKEDYLIKHIPNTINIPYYELPDKIDKLNLNKASKIFLVCYTGRHSKALCPLKVT